MTFKLNQVIAVEKGVKAGAASALTKAYHLLQKAALFAGQERTYKRRADDGEQYPPEPVKLQLKVETVLRDLVPTLSRFYDVTLTKDAANQVATADITVDDVVIATNVPVTSMLFLEKQLGDLVTVISKLPVLDGSENWTQNATTGAFQTDAAITTKSKKVPVTIIKVPATDKFPAQTEFFTEDQVVGEWHTVKLSGAITETKRQELLAKVQKLQAAVKVARETANMTEVVDRQIGAAVFDYLGW